MCIYVRRYRDASAPVGGKLKRSVEGVVRLSPQFLRVAVDLPWSVLVVRFLCVFFGGVCAVHVAPMELSGGRDDSETKGSLRFHPPPPPNK